MKHFSHLNTATQLIQQYDGKEPFHLHLKHFFRQHTKYGSKDRRRISHLCYCFFRVANAFGDFPSSDTENLQQVMLAGLFFCSNEQDELLQASKPGWNEMIHLPAKEKESFAKQGGVPIDLSKIFPAINEVSEELDKEHFSLSHLLQPDLFIRIRPGNTDTVIQKLQTNGVQFEKLSDTSIAFPNGTKIDSILQMDREVVVQDLSSQMIGNYLPLESFRNPAVWDCCAASGGKSILATDIMFNISLTVSDIRESILANLERRFAVAGIRRYKSFVKDLSISGPPLTVPGAPFDLILADLPCTGSGTWGRTPERLCYFEASTIEKYSDLQKKIAQNAIPHLKESGKLLYSTCSVFRKENEEVVDFISEKFSMKVERWGLIKGYTKRADTMFGALLSFR